MDVRRLLQLSPGRNSARHSRRKCLAGCDLAQRGIAQAADKVLAEICPFALAPVLKMAQDDTASIPFRVTFITDLL